VSNPHLVAFLAQTHRGCDGALGALLSEMAGDLRGGFDALLRMAAAIGVVVVVVEGDGEQRV